MDEAGYSAGWSFLSGLFIYAGSMQIVMVSLLTAGASLGTIALMTFYFILGPDQFILPALAASVLVLSMLKSRSNKQIKDRGLELEAGLTEPVEEISYEY